MGHIGQLFIPPLIGFVLGLFCAWLTIVMHFKATFFVLLQMDKVIRPFLIVGMVLAVIINILVCILNSYGIEEIVIRVTTIILFLVTFNVALGRLIRFRMLKRILIIYRSNQPLKDLVVYEGICRYLLSHRAACEGLIQNLTIEELLLKIKPHDDAEPVA